MTETIMQSEEAIYTANVHTTGGREGGASTSASVSQLVFLTLAVCAAFGVGGMTLAQLTGKDQVKVTQLSQRDIIETLEGKAASARNLGA